MDLEDETNYYSSKPESDEFLISREALDEAHSALAGCLVVNGDVANISHAMKLLRTAQGCFGDTYDGHWSRLYRK